MKLTVDGKLYDLDAGSLTNKEAILLEDLYGMTFQEFGELLTRGSTKAMTGLVWLAMRRDGSDIAFEDVEFHFEDFETDEVPAGPLSAADERSEPAT